jgi:hypothetical protein
MGFRSFVARLVICGLALGLHQPVSAQDQGHGVGDWRRGAIDHMRRMRKYEGFDHRSDNMPSVVAKSRFDWDPTGVIATTQPGGPTIAARNAFFANLGTNGRTCFTCHQPQDGWSVSAAGAKARFAASLGSDPLFRVVDGATCPSAPVATLADKRKAYKLLIEKGLIRVGLPLPAAQDLQFEVTAVDDPYKCTTSRDTGLISPTEGIVSIYRRPLPSTNLAFNASIMWDGREPTLESQAVDATLIHAEADAAPGVARQAQMVGFEKGLYTAQIFDARAHRLDADKATGGPALLALLQPSFYVGINDPLGRNPTGAPFDPAIFDLYESWAGTLRKDREAQHRRSVARGEHEFNGGFCGFCHNTPNVGSHSVDAFLNIGVADAKGQAALDIVGLPVFTLTCTKGPLAKQVFEVTDPGRASITGQCADIGAFKVPGLRGLASRAPYFHNGAASTLAEVVEFYDQRFALQLTQEQKDDLVNFLAAL